MKVAFEIGIYDGPTTSGDYLFGLCLEFPRWWDVRKVTVCSGSAMVFLIGIEVRMFESRDTRGTTTWRLGHRMWNGQAKIPTNRAQRY